MGAEFQVLFTGYVGGHVASTVSFVRDGNVRVIIDPGMVPEPAAILGPLAKLVHSPDEITDVIFSHHHPDHTLNAALFPRARFHDFWAIYRGDTWERRPAEGFALSPSIRPDGNARAHAARHHHDGLDQRGHGGVHAPLVVGGGASRGPAGLGPVSPSSQPGAGAGDRRAHRPRPWGSIQAFT